MMWVSGDWTEIDAKNLQIEHLKETIERVRELANYFENASDSSMWYGFDISDAILQALDGEK